MTLLWIAVGGAIGAMGRFGISSWSNRHFHHSPIGTFIVNISGAFLLGIVAGLAEQRIEMAGDAYRFIVVGILGSYTTFSTLFYETFILAEAEKRVPAFIYVVGSFVVGLLAVFAGLSIGRW